ncbi:hypothetical protein HYW20_06810 [Candidatus Woesearchaeota archaeon]|nr:hypothetical protein [Candidatus Woesearchaeota archaeon]
MSKLSRLVGKEGKRLSDLSEEEQEKIVKPVMDAFYKKLNPIFNKPLPKFLDNSWLKHRAKEKAQPFKTNYLLEDMIKEIQTTTRLTKGVLFVTVLALFIGLWALLHSYNII